MMPKHADGPKYTQQSPFANPVKGGLSIATDEQTLAAYTRNSPGNSKVAKFLLASSKRYCRKCIGEILDLQKDVVDEQLRALERCVGFVSKRKKCSKCRFPKPTVQFVLDDTTSNLVWMEG
jgi:hypothetical protein